MPILEKIETDFQMLIIITHYHHDDDDRRTDDRHQKNHDFTSP